MAEYNNTEYDGPIHGKVKLRPSAFEASSDGGDLVPAQGYSTASVNSDDFGIQGGILEGNAAKLSADYPTINSNASPNTGRNLYEPLRIAFVHKFGGPHVDTNDHLSYLDPSYVIEEVARVNIRPDKENNVFPPYTCATITGVAFPYGQTNKGIVHPDINKVKTVMFRDKFTFDLVHPNIDQGPNLYNYDPSNPGVSTPGAGFYAPLYSSSIINYYNSDPTGISNREFQLNTDASDFIQSYGSFGNSIEKGTVALSVHPEISRGETSNFIGVNSYSTVLGGASGWAVGTYNINSVQHRVQGETDGNTVSFKMTGHLGCIVKGLIELF